MAAVAALLLLCTYRSFGATWDEGIQDEYGQRALRYFTSGFHDRSNEQLANLRFYGPLVEMILVVLRRGGATDFDSRHLWLSMLALVAIPALAVFCRGFQRPALGVLAVACLALTPRFMGHVPNNSKDVPFAVALTLFMAVLVRLLSAPELGWRRALALGATAGLVLSVRPGSLPILGVLSASAALVALLFVRDGWIARRPHWSTLLQLLVGGVVAWVLMVAFWPWAQEAPLAHPLTAAWNAVHFGAVYPVLFAGKVYQSDSLPIIYLPKYLLIVLPPAWLVLAATGIYVGVRRTLRGERGEWCVAFWVAVAWILLPMLLLVVLHPNVYDGIRHVLFILPPVAVLAALGILQVVDVAQRRLRRVLAWTLVCSAVFFFPALAIARLHPYQTSYFNALVGGLRGAADRYEVDYWGSSYRAAILWLREQREGSAPITLLVGGNGYLRNAAMYYAGDRVRVVMVTEAIANGLPLGAFDYYLGMRHYRLSQEFPEAQVVYTVARQGVQLAVLKKLSPSDAHE